MKICHNPPELAGSIPPVRLNEIVEGPRCRVATSTASWGERRLSTWLSEEA